MNDHIKFLREPAHTSLTSDQISNLVERFYEKISIDERLGPIFLTRNHGEWDVHLSRMKQFWCTILLKSGEYKGDPQGIHMAIEELQSSDFLHWLTVFEETSFECFEKPAAEIANAYARRIARSLWLFRFGSPFDHPPF